MLLDEQLFLAPIGSNPQRILDLGTGSGDFNPPLSTHPPSATSLLTPFQESAQWTWRTNSPPLKSLACNRSDSTRMDPPTALSKSTTSKKILVEQWNQSALPFLCAPSSALHSESILPIDIPLLFSISPPPLCLTIPDKRQR